MSDTQTPPRFDWLDVAKGLGILLVIYGHAIGGVRDAGMIAKDGFLSSTFYFVYTFHMPMFMFLAGILVETRIAKSRSRFFKSLGTGLVLPYLLWAPVAILILSSTSSLTNGGSAGQLAKSLIGIFVTPPGWLWFFYGLFLCHVAALVVPFGRYGLLLFGLAILPLNTMLEMLPLFSVTSHMLVFYALGVAIGPALIGAPLRVPVAVAPVMALIFACSSWLVWREGQNYWSLQALAAAISGSALLLALSASSFLRNNRALSYVGKRSMAIYVLHIFFVAGIRIVADKVLGVRDGAILLPVIVLGGLIGPLIVYEFASWLRISEWIGLGKPLRWVSPRQSQNV